MSKRDNEKIYGFDSTEEFIEWKQQRKKRKNEDRKLTHEWLAKAFALAGSGQFVEAREICEEQIDPIQIKWGWKPLTDVYFKV